MGGPTTAPLPIVVGVVGHRHPSPEDVEGLASALRSIFADFRSRYPHTPIVMLNALAEGCDWIAADVARELGIRMVAPLPMEAAEYERDFVDEGRRARFRSLLAEAVEVVVVSPSLVPAGEEMLEGIERDRRYEAAGAYIARNSQILVAMWDGEINGLIGGTSQVIDFRLNGIPEPYAPARNPLDPIDNGPVLHIVTRRAGAPAPSDLFAVRPIYPSRFEGVEEAAASYAGIYERIDGLNRDAAEHGASLEEERRRSREYLLPSAAAELLPPAMLRLMEQFTLADTLASVYQRHTVRVLRGLFTVVFVAVFFFELYAHVFYENVWVIGLYLAALLAAYLWHFRAGKRDYQSKHLDYRALAEGLRIQFYWNLAGISEQAVDYYMRRQQSVLDWIRDAMRAWTITPATTAADTGSLPDRTRLDLVAEHWVEAQLGYFRHAVERDERQLKRLERWINLFFGLGLAVAIGQIILHGGHGIILLMGMLPVTAAMLHGYTEKRALSETVKQYERMGMIFVYAARRLREAIDAGDLEGAQALIRDIGKEALTENGDWVLLHRERPVEVPHAG